MIWGETPEILLKPQLEISDGPLERIACFERGLFDAAHKDIFFRKEIKWFGKILSGQTVSHPEGTQGLSELRRPETAGKIVQFLQAINWMPTSLPELAELESATHGVPSAWRRVVLLAATSGHQSRDSL